MTPSHNPEPEFPPIRVEYLIVHGDEAENSINEILKDLLREVLETNQNEFDDEATALMITPQTSRAVVPDEEQTEGEASTIYGFALDLPLETVRPEQVIENFTDEMAKTVPIAHVLKFYDSLLWQQNVELAEELFELEMRLRQVLSLIYLHNTPNKPYDLLDDETEQPMSKESPQEEQLKAAAENEFFYLTFRQYASLNQRKRLGHIMDFVARLRDANSFEAFRDELDRQPIENEDDQLFISSLKEALDVVEKVRNAIAHNRRVPKKVLEDYETNAKPNLLTHLHDYLDRCTIVVPDSDVESKQE